MSRKRGKHLSLVEREKIMVLLEKGVSKRAIDRQLGFSNGTVSYEIKKNKNQNTGEYLAIKAHRKALIKEKSQRQKASLKDPQIYLYVKQKLRQFWSPEEIAGRIKIDLPGCQIDDETIYRFIHNQKKHPHEDLFIYLARPHQKRQSKFARQKYRSSHIPDKMMIQERSPVVHLRTVYGHFETDLMEGLRSDNIVVSVSTERKTRYVLLDKLSDKKASSKASSIVKQLQFLSPQSITTDNGFENTFHQSWQQNLNCLVYFTTPYHSWEKGTVENTIGRLRFFLPKKKSLKDLTQKELSLIQELMNNTPRKCLNYLTPKEALQIELKRLKYSKVEDFM